jgi:shikimate dehydrogenase
VGVDATGRGGAAEREGAGGSDIATDGHQVHEALNQLALTLDLVGGYAYVVDLVYRNGLTPLLLAARERGVPTLDGLEVLVAQGALSLELWTGRPAPVEVMRRAVRGQD